MQIGGGDDELQVSRLQRLRSAYGISPSTYTHVVGIERQWVRRALGSTPERLASARHGILGQAEQQLPDGVVVLFLELQAGPYDALLERQRLVGDQVGDKLLNLLPLLPGVLEVVLEVVRLGEVRVDSLCRLYEQVVELSSGPLQRR